MQLKSLRAIDLKRFTDFTITDIPASARVVVLAGPNGAGKSSVFDALRTWHWANGGTAGGWDETYGTKAGSPPRDWPSRVQVEFHDSPLQDVDDRRRLVYVRSAFRNEADFQVHSISRMGSPLDSPGVQRLIDTDATVSSNYQRLLMQTIDGVFNDDLAEDMTRVEVRDRIIGDVRTALAKVFPDLQLEAIAGFGTAESGTFYFSKGKSKRFLYKNLSGGEKSCFDLLLDAVIKAPTFTNTLWCIDEPETHLNTRIQGSLLQALVDLIPPQSQLLIASHSIGFMRRAWEIEKASPGTVAFIDMHGHDFDQPVSICPVPPSRELWATTLDVALGDLASLMAPEQIVLCEGRPRAGQGDSRAEFDAQCYRKIFAAEFPGTDFLSVGASTDVTHDRLEAGRAIQAIASGTRVLRVVDRDGRTDEEIAELNATGINVLSRRHIESYLLDDEVLAALCSHLGDVSRVAELKQMRDDAISASIDRNNAPDDWKSASNEFFAAVRTTFSLQNAGTSFRPFAIAHLTPLIRPEMTVYQELRAAIFGNT